MSSISPKKLLNSKWTAVNPSDKEKHFLVTEVEFNEQGAVVHCLVETLMTRRTFTISWRDLKNTNEWIAGWR
ncbi:MAG: TIGR02450 family Trp-rich protein [Lysobacterales bacterium]